MITRIWHGMTDKGKAEKYLTFLLDNGTREYRETRGNISVKVWKKVEGDCSHFYTVSEWEDLEAIKRFAGEDYQHAVYYPEDEGILLEFEKSVVHHETYDVSATRIKNHIRRLKQLLEGDGWLGENFRHKLKDVDQHMAFKTPSADTHCIAALLWHCTYWKKVAIKHIYGDHSFREKTFDDMNFLPVEELKSRGWERIKDDFFKTHNELIESLGSKNDSLLRDKYQPGYTYDYLIGGIIQHDAYHLGQIGLIKKMLGDDKGR